MRQLAFLIFVALLSPVAQAAAGFFEVGPWDKSLTYLGAVFGGMGGLPIPPEGNSLFANILSRFNQVVFALGLIIVIFTGLSATVHTAHEGEAMGKKWSIIWVPLRAISGLAFLLPSPGSGYSFIQMTMMYFIIQGVGAANQIWERVVLSYERGERINETVSADMTQSSLQNKEQFLKDYLQSLICVQKYNQKNPTLDPLFLLESDSNCSNSNAVLDYILSTSPQVAWITGEIANCPPTPCGAFKAPSPKKTWIDSNDAVNTYKQSYVNLMSSLAEELNPVVEEALSPTPYSEWTTPLNIRSASMRLESGIKNIEAEYNKIGSNTADLAAIQKNLTAMRQDGWIHAGSYYYEIVVSRAQAQVKAPITINYTPPSETSPEDTQDTKSVVDKIWARAAELTPKRPDQYGVATQVAGGGQGNIFDETVGALFRTIAYAIMDAIGNQKNTDPMISIASAGQGIMIACEVAFLLTIAILPILAWAGFPPCGNPIGQTTVTIAFLMAILLSTVCGLLWSAGVMMGVYAPMIPWLIYTFTAIGWIILVIEAIVAAPLVALVLTVPSEDELGKAGHALVILLGLVLRPSLMVLGFILGSKVMFVSIGMLNFGFKEMIRSNIHGLGLFGWAAVVGIYVGVLLSIISQAFSLIYLVPDKVLRWMGGQGESEDVSGKVEEIKGKSEGAAKTTEGAMKSGRAASEGLGKMRK